MFQADHNLDVNVEEDDDGELALWSPEIKIVELVKDHKGLGFSILDYQVKNLYRVLGVINLY